MPEWNANAGTRHDPGQTHNTHDTDTLGGPSALTTGSQVQGNVRRHELVILKPRP